MTSLFVAFAVGEIAFGVVANQDERLEDRKLEFTGFQYREFDTRIVLDIYTLQ